jgi:hypothetical protein
MDAGGLAGRANGQLLTVWTRDRQLFHCQPGKQEESLGPGQQAWAAAGSAGHYLVWLQKRSGALLALAPGESKPRVLAEKASDPVAAGSPDGKGPVIAAWEELRGNAVQITALRLTPRTR